MISLRFSSLLVCLLVPVLAGNPTHAQDLTFPGGDLTTDKTGPNAIQVAAPNVSDGERRNIQLSGFAIFHGRFLKATGLGPDFVNTSCGRCHLDNGKGPAKFSKTNRAGSSMIVKVSLRGLKPDGTPRNVPGLGEQLQDQALAGARKAAVDLQWLEVKGKYGDGTPYKLRRPKLTFKLEKTSTRKMVTSLRMTPPVIGPGLLEAVPDSVIMELNDPDDLNGDGISGHPNYVPALRTGEVKIGRFGFRASHPNVEEQTAAALFNDIGVTNPILFQSGKEQEFSEDALNRLTVYQKLAGIPRATNQDDPIVMQGKELFKSVGCDSCHRMTMRTEEYIDPELSNQEFHPMTDLLLHDMGTGLADKRPEFSASGREWRTTPLWGLGFAAGLRRGKVVYLHDGRARTVEEAILWHGGEAAGAQERFKNLTKAERDALVAFLKSL